MSGSMIVNYKVLGVEVMPGTYFLGDPQYAMPDYQFKRMLRDEDFQNWPVARQMGSKVLAYLTALGGGQFQCQDGYTYTSISGLIGLFPLDEIAEEYHALLPKMGRIVTFTKPALCMSIDGVLHFNTLKRDAIVLDTNDQVIG